MADDYLIQAALGVLEGFGGAYIPYTKAVTDDALTRRRDERKFQMEKDLLTQRGEQTKDIMASSPNVYLDNEGNPQTYYGKSLKVAPVAKPTPEQTIQNDIEKTTAIENIKADVGARKSKELADIKLQATKPKARKALDGTIAGLTEIETKIDRLLNDKDLSWGTGWQSKIMTAVPGSKANEVENLIASINSGLSLDTLAEMRANSPTGGALGNVSDAEGKRLESKRAKLDPAAGDKIFRNALIDAKSSLQGTRQRMLSAYSTDFGEDIPTPAIDSTPQGNGSGLSPEQRRARIAELRAKMGKK